MIIELYSNNNQQTNNFASDYLKKNHFGKIISLPSSSNNMIAL